MCKCKCKDKPAPPTVDVAAQMFLGYSREYLELVPLLRSFPGYLGSEVPDNEWTRTARRVAILHSSLGRKFVTRGEAAHIPSLIDWILKERGNQLPPNVSTYLENVQQEVRNLVGRIRQGVGSVGRTGGTHVSSGEHWFDVLYADVLHSDYDRWLRRGEAAWVPVFMHMATALGDIRDLVSDMRWVIVELSRIGVLDTAGVDLTLAEEIEPDDWTPSNDKPGSPGE